MKKKYKNKKKPIVLVTGCVAQAENDEMLKREPYIDLVIGPQSYHKINDTILNYIKKKNTWRYINTFIIFFMSILICYIVYDTLVKMI